MGEESEEVAADEEDTSEDDAEELAADGDADEEDTSDDDAEELAAYADADQQDSLVDNLLLNRALRGGNPRMVLVDDLDEATIGAAKKKKAAKKKPAAKKKEKTVGVLKKSDIIKTKYGGYVSKKASASAKKK